MKPGRAAVKGDGVRGRAATRSPSGCKAKSRKKIMRETKQNKKKKNGVGKSVSSVLGQTFPQPGMSAV